MKAKQGFILALIFIAFNGYALTLKQAESTGLVGEMPNGYLGIVVDKPSDALQTLVKEINRKRRQHYITIAEEHDTNLLHVEVIAGQELIKRTPSGYYFQQAGRWHKKP